MYEKSVVHVQSCCFPSKPVAFFSGFFCFFSFFDVLVAMASKDRKVPISKVPISKVPISKVPISKVPISKVPISKVPISKVPVS